MALYYYQAFDATGKKRTGHLEFTTEKEAKERLRAQGLLITHLSSTNASKSKENLRKESLQTFTLELSQLVNADIPLYESLIAIEQGSRKQPYHKVLLSLCDQVKRGNSLSKAMQSHPASFDPLYTALVSSGEASGSLGFVLERLSFLLARKEKLRREISAAIIYPTILGSFALIVICLLLGFVVPSIEGIFEGRKMGGLTQFVLLCSYGFRTYFWHGLISLSLLGFFASIWFKKAVSQETIERFLLKIPKIRGLIIESAFTRFIRTLATLHHGGLTLVDSLKIARDVLQNKVLEKEVEKAEERIIEGSSLSRELARSSCFPEIALRMIAIGEESATLSSMLEKIATIYEEKMEKNLSRMMALLQPLILLIMGVIIGLVMIAILLPLTDLSSFSNME